MCMAIHLSILLCWFDDNTDVPLADAAFWLKLLGDPALTAGQDQFGHKCIAKSENWKMETLTSELPLDHHR